MSQLLDPKCWQSPEKSIARCLYCGARVRFSKLLAFLELGFRRFGLLDGQERFLKGWFCDTLAAAPIERLAILRLDGDMYLSESGKMQTCCALIQV